MCQSQFWSIALLLADGFALLYGVLLCYQVRNTPSQFNESKWIAYSLYNTGIVTPRLFLSSFPTK
jgi:hypothetical protein